MMLKKYIKSVRKIEKIMSGLIFVTVVKTLSISMQIRVVNVIETMLVNDWSNWVMATSMIVQPCAIDFQTQIKNVLKFIERPFCRVT